MSAKNARGAFFRRLGGVGVLEELQPGDPVRVGPYRLAGVLGAGGMGRVFLGWSSGGRPVAVKVIRPDLAADPEFRTRFRREVAAARAISGLYTAQLIDADTDGKVPWLATVYVDGPSLNEAVTSYGPLPAASVLALAAGLAEALAAVHATGLAHRDLKPSNVLLAPDGPRVIDFGISRAADTTTLTSTGQSIGSPGFLSPEQALGSEAGPPSDIFSLGAVLAFAASGNGPFGSGSAPALVYRVVHEPPTMEGVPEELRPLIGRCLAKDPADRPAAGDLLAELADVQPDAQWLPERITAALAGFAASPPTQPAADGAAGAAADERTATSVVPGDGVPRPGAAAGGAGRSVGGSRRSRLPRRGLLVPAVSAAVVLAAVAVALAATVGGTGGPARLTGGSPTASAGALAAAARPVTSSASTPSPVHSTSATPKHSPSHKAAAKKTVKAQAPPAVVTVTAAPPAQPSSAPPAPSPTPSASATVGGACSFIVNGNLDCASTNPEVLLYVYFDDNTTGCTFVRDITWGDGTASDVVVDGGPAGPKYVTSHTYSTPGAYTIYFGDASTTGDCTPVTPTYQFDYLSS